MLEAIERKRHENRDKLLNMRKPPSILKKEEEKK